MNQDYISSNTLQNEEIVASIEVRFFEGLIYFYQWRFPQSLSYEAPISKVRNTFRAQ